MTPPRDSDGYYDFMSAYRGPAEGIPRSVGAIGEAMRATDKIGQTTWVPQSASEHDPRPPNITPLHIRLMLHYYAIAEPWEPSGGANDDYTKELVSWGLIIACEPFCGSGYRATEAGEAWVSMLCATPFPVERWVDPRETK